MHLPRIPEWGRACGAALCVLAPRHNVRCIERRRQLYEAEPSRQLSPRSHLAAPLRASQVRDSD